MAINLKPQSAIARTAAAKGKTNQADANTEVAFINIDYVTDGGRKVSLRALAVENDPNDEDKQFLFNLLKQDGIVAAEFILAQSNMRVAFSGGGKQPSIDPQSTADRFAAFKAAKKAA